MSIFRPRGTLTFVMWWLDVETKGRGVGDGDHLPYDQADVPLRFIQHVNFHVNTCPLGPRAAGIRIFFLPHIANGRNRCVAHLCRDYVMNMGSPRALEVSLSSCAGSRFTGVQIMGLITNRSGE